MAGIKKKTLYAKEYNIVYQGKFSKVVEKLLPVEFLLPSMTFIAVSVVYGSPLVAIAAAALMAVALLISNLMYVDAYEDVEPIGIHGTKKRYLFQLGTAVTAIKDVREPARVAAKPKAYASKMLYPVLIDEGMPLTHAFVVGTTGAGKTTFEVNILKQILDSGSGTLAVDGKGDQTIYEAFFNTCVDSGREDDFRVINFNNPFESHTFNPMLKGTADEVVDIIGNMLETSGDNAFWAGRAITFMKALLSILVPLRDMGLLFNSDLEKEPILTFGVVNSWISLQDLRKLYWVILKSNEIGELDVNSFSPEERRKYEKIDLSRLRTYLISVSVDLSAEDTELAEGSTKQHGNSYLMWNESLDMLAGRFGPIFDTDSPSIDMEDVISNGRILYVLLPAMKVDTRSLASLGKIILSLLKNAVSYLLGDNISGSVEERYLSFAKRPRVPFFAFMDEYGSYAVEGFDNVLAQARSLRVSVFILAQEIASLQKISDIEKKRLLGNTGIKVALKIEEQDTIDEVIKMLGKREEAVIRVRQEKQEEDERDIEVQEKEVVTTEMLKEMVPGHGYIMWAGKTQPFLVRYYDPPISPEIPKFDYFMDAIEPLYMIGEIKKKLHERLGNRYASPGIADDEDDIAVMLSKINSVFDVSATTFGVDPAKLGSREIAALKEFADEEAAKRLIDEFVRKSVSKMDEIEKKASKPAA